MRKGQTVKVDGKLYAIVDYQHVKLGKGGAVYQTKLKSLTDGSIQNIRLRAEEIVEEAFLDKRTYEYLYSSGSEHVLMDTTTYDQITLPRAMVEEIAPMMKENTVVSVQMREGQPIGMDLPTFVDLEVVETAPGVKGDTVAGGTKPAKLETGKVIQVPLFVEQGTVVRVDTRTGEYVSRV